MIANEKKPDKIQKAYEETILQEDVNIIHNIDRTHRMVVDALHAFVEQYDKLKGYPNIINPFAGAYVAAKGALKDTWKEWKIR
jgi:hypothetical protein